MDKDFSSYPEEQEVLLHDGLEFLVIDFKYQMIDDYKEVAFVKLYNNSRHSIPENIRNSNYELSK